MAILIATLGIYASLNFMVVHGTREIGVRLAIGATPSQAAGAVLRQGLMFVATGVMFGIPLALFSGRFLESLLFGINARDQVTYLVSAGVAAFLAVVASTAPARRAARTDPVIALRSE